MHVPRDARFDEDAERFALRFCCDHCGFFDEDAERCRHGWPTAPHRAARYRTAPTADSPAESSVESSGDTVVFCKEFELR